MPTTHIEPTSGPLLQDVADVLGKSRKVVVVTGAGISTNSGIPDFRSKNGLYSLIQARLDATSSKDSAAASKCYDGTDLDGPPPKRRRLTVEQSITVQTREGDSIDVVSSPNFPTDSSLDKGEVPRQDQSHGTQDFSPGLPPRADNMDQGSTASHAVVTGELGAADSTSDQPIAGSSILVCDSPKAAEPAFSSSTPPSSDSEAPAVVPYVSSPLSSPPPNLFDPYDSSSPCTRTASRRHSVSSTSSADSSKDDPSSQSSLSNRNTLPNLKGKDLFDASIWADPVRTSVFYTFATELRRKTKDAEPTSSHRFISHLRDRGKLVRCYTQNIDEIEEKVGLATGLDLGPGSRGRFSLKTGSRASLKATDTPIADSTGTSTPGDSAVVAEEDKQPEKETRPSPRRDPGVECVYLHGSLNSLRCFTCGQISDWDEGDREDKTLSGMGPRCPHCEAATAARQERGKRALGIGKLRPDIVLYGEEHPNAHLISPIVQHDLALCPDMMIILGTSLRVHGLKVMVREFAKTIHNRGGKVVFVNLTKPPESVWSDVIDYWIQWDCDAWVQDLKERKPVLWLPPGVVMPEEKKAPKRKRTLGRENTTASQASQECLQEDSQISIVIKDKLSKAQQKCDVARIPLPDGQPETSISAPRKAAPKIRKPIYKPDAKYPAAMREDKRCAAYLVIKIRDDLAKFAGRERPVSTIHSNIATSVRPTETKRKPPRKSAPASLGVKRDSQAMAGGDDDGSSQPAKRIRKSVALPIQPDREKLVLRPQDLASATVSNCKEENDAFAENSILAAVKSNPRKRRPKMINGVAVSLPTRGSSAKNKGPSAGLPVWSYSSEDKENLTEYPAMAITSPPRHSVLPPLRMRDSSRPGSTAFIIPCIAPIGSFKASVGSMLPRPEPIHADSMAKRMPISPPPNLRSPIARKMRHHFFLSDPLVDWPISLRPTTNPPSTNRDWSPGAQLQSEQLWSEQQLLSEQVARGDDRPAVSGR